MVKENLFLFHQPNLHIYISSEAWCKQIETKQDTLSHINEFVNQGLEENIKGLK